MKWRSGIRGSELRLRESLRVNGFLAVVRVGAQRQKTFFFEGAQQHGLSVQAQGTVLIEKQNSRLCNRNRIDAFSLIVVIFGPLLQRWISDLNLYCAETPSSQS